MIRRAAVLIIAAMLLTSLPAAANFTIALQSGTLTFPGTTLTGDVILINANAVPTWRVDTRNTTSGWNVTLQISNFTATGGKTITASNLTYTAVNGTITKVGGGSQNVDPTNGPKETGVTGTLDTARKCVTTNPNYGDGRYDWTADMTQFDLTIPANALVGSYSATLTATLVSGP